MNESELFRLAFQQGLPTLLIVGIAAFVVFRVWPWWTKEYLPARQKADMEVRKLEMARDDRRDAALEALRTTLAELPLALSQSTGVAVREQAGAAVQAAESSIIAAVNAARLDVLRGQEALGDKLAARVDAAAFDSQAVQDVVKHENDALETRMFNFIGALMRPSAAQSIVEGKKQ